MVVGPSPESSSELRRFEAKCPIEPLLQAVFQTDLMTAAKQLWKLLEIGRLLWKLLEVVALLMLRGPKFNTQTPTNSNRYWNSSISLTQSSAEALILCAAEPLRLWKRPLPTLP